MIEKLKGIIIVGIVCKDGVVLVVDRRVLFGNMVFFERVMKVF